MANTVTVLNGLINKTVREVMNESQLSSANILLIDDEQFSLRFTTEILKQLGVGGISTAENGAVALALLSADEAEFDLAICDIQMPGMDGFEFVRRVRYGTAPGFKDLPILMLTGHDTDENIQSARIHKINGFVVKPPNIKDLRIKLTQALGI